MTDPARDLRANERLSVALWQKGVDRRIHVSRIRPGLLENSVEVRLQFWGGESSSSDMTPITVSIPFAMNLGPDRGVLDDDIVDAVADAFPYDTLPDFD